MAGAGYKLFNTGDVLTAAQVNTYLQEQVVMVFNDATARTTALSGVLAEGMVSYLKSTDAVEIYNGSAWVGIAADQTPLTTKGDLFTYSTTDARLGVGNNGETLVADSSTSTGLRYTSGNPVGNPVINGAFDVWQRGTSVAGANSTSNYTADRWIGYRTNYTFSRQSVGDTTNLPTIQYCMRAQRNSGVTATDDFALSSSFETSNSIRFAGQTVTLSFWARKGANYSATSSAFKSYITAGTGTDQNALSGFTNGIDYVQTNTLTTTWQRFTQTQTLNSAVTQIAIQFVGSPTGTAGAADYVEITGIQLDLGSVALPFRRSGNTLAGELVAAQRYYWRNTGGNGGYAGYGVGSYSSATQAEILVNFPTSMRISPTTLEYSTLGVTDTAAVQAVTGLAVSYSNPNAAMIYPTVASGGTQYRSCKLVNNNNSTTAYLAFTAEL